VQALEKNGLTKDEKIKALEQDAEQYQATIERLSRMIEQLQQRQDQQEDKIRKIMHK